MKFAEKFLNMMKINDYDESEEFDEDYEGYEEDYEGDIYEEEEVVEKEKKPIFSFHRKSKEVEEVEDEFEENEEAESRVIPFNGNQEEGEVVKVIKPQEFNEAKVVAEFLKEGKTIVVNLEGMEISQAQRIIDFIGGASFAVDGSLKAISNNIFIVAPGNIEVSGDLRKEVIGDDTLSPEIGKF